MEDDQLIMFDANGAIRMYNPEKFEELLKTMETEKRYLGKMDEFKQMVAQTMDVANKLGDAIEREKLMAIGARNVVEGEAAERFRVAQEAQLRLREKQMELDRYVAEYESLKRVEQEQQQTFQRLSQAQD